MHDSGFGPGGGELSHHCLMRFTSASKSDLGVKLGSIWSTLQTSASSSDALPVDCILF